MSSQSEAVLENNLIKRLSENGYERVKIRNESELLSNFRTQLDKLNKCQLTDEEFEKVVLFLEQGSIFDKAKKLRDHFFIERENDSFYIKFLNQKDWCKNIFQVTNQIDITLENKTVCLKVYTLADDSKIITKDISVDYLGGSYFTAQVLSADGHAVVGETVKFTIAGKTYTIKTDANGIAKLKINLIPNKYSIVTEFNAKKVKNTVTVKQVLKVYSLTVKKTAKSFTLKASLKINGKMVKGKVITFKFMGKTYKVKTDSKGIAKKTLGKTIIKKLKIGKTYTVKALYCKTSVKTTLKVR